MITKKRAFLSFIAEDKKKVDGLRLLAANPDYDLDFYDESVKAAIDSRDAAYIKSQIRDRINRTTVTVCLISENTHWNERVRHTPPRQAQGKPAASRYEINS
jgi:hypothetical protein